MKRALFGILVAGFSCLSNMQATRMDALVTGSPTFPHPNVMTATQLSQTVLQLLLYRKRQHPAVRGFGVRLSSAHFLQSIRLY